MKLSRDRVRLPAVALALFWGHPGDAAQLLQNGDFAADISGWILPSAPDTTVTWDADGLPAGSLRIDSTWAAPPASPIEAFSPCFTVEPGESYVRSADARAAVGSGGSCNVDVVFYDDATCSGAYGAYTFSGTQSEGAWEHIEDAHATGLAFRISLRMVRYPTPAATCWFDNVALVGPDPSPLEIPAVDRTGLVLLCLVVGAAGSVAVRMSRREPRRL